MLELIWIVIIGAVVGALAKLIMPGRDPGGFSSRPFWAWAARSSPRFSAG